MFYMGVGGLVRGTSFVYKKEKILQIKDLQDLSAERQGFEPWIQSPVCRISSAVHSTTLASLLAKSMQSYDFFSKGQTEFPKKTDIKDATASFCASQVVPVAGYIA